jgi:hypothetical protein
MELKGSTFIQKPQPLYPTDSQLDPVHIFTHSKSQHRSTAHPPSYQICTGGYFPGG